MKYPTALLHGSASQINKYSGVYVYESVLGVNVLEMSMGGGRWGGGGGAFSRHLLGSPPTPGRPLFYPKHNFD